jgi:hypothetical protein
MLLIVENQSQLAPWGGFKSLEFVIADGAEWVVFPPRGLALKSTNDL